MAKSRTRYAQQFAPDTHALIIAIGAEVHRGNIRNALNDGANAALLSSISPDALISALNSVVNTNAGLLAIDSRLWSSERQPELYEPKSAEQAPQEQASREQEQSPSIHDVPSGAVDSDIHTLELLTAREIAILERIVRGDSNKHIARFFHIAEPTVKAHVKAIFRKIGASNRTFAAIWAVNHRLFDGNAAPQELPAKLLHADGDIFIKDRGSPPHNSGTNGIPRNGLPARSRLS